MTDAERTRLPRSLKLWWGLGQLAPYTIISIVGAEMMLYFTDRVGLAPAVAGAILAAAKAYDAGSDFVIGLLSDRFDTPWGRRRPWLLAGALMLALATVGMFWIDVLPRRDQLSAATAAVLLFYTGFSAFTIPHMAMAAEICRDYHERTSLQVYAQAFAIASGLVGSAAAPALIVAFGSGTAAFHQMALIMAAVPLLAGLACFVGTASAPSVTTVGTVKLKAHAWLRTLVQNQPLLILVTAKMLHYFGTASTVTAMIYMCTYVLGIGQKGMVVFGLAGSAGGVGGVLLMSQVAKGRKKHQLYAAALVGMSLNIGAFALIPHGDMALFALPSFGTGFIGVSGLMMARSMVADVVEYDYLRNGVRRAGAVSSLISALEKTMPALSALFIGLLLSWGGYVAGKGTAAQPDSAIRAIYLGVVVIPSLFLLLAAAPLLLFYRLDEAHLAAMAAKHG